VLVIAQREEQVLLRLERRVARGVEDLIEAMVQK
jgi:hypothetical protein